MEYKTKNNTKRLKELENFNQSIFADEELLAEDWISEEDNEAWKNL